jgi:type I restriction enzyme S subunit
MIRHPVTLGSIAKITSGGTPDRNNTAYWNGSIPWVKTSQIQNCEIAAESIDESITQEGLEQSSARIIPKGTILMAMYGQGKTRGQVAILGLNAAINQACAAIQLQPGVDRDYVYQQLRFRYESIRALSNTGSQENLNAELVREISFPLPDFPEQEAIGQRLALWDAAMERAEKLIAAKERRLDLLRVRLVVNDRGSKKVKLKSVTRESIQRNAKQLGRIAIMAVTKKSGMRPMKEEIIAADIDRYKVVAPGAFAYNPMRLNIGSIVMSGFQSDVLVSPDYVVFECDKTALFPGFLNHLRFTRSWTNHFSAAGSGSVRVRIYYDDLAAFTVSLPPIDEQRRISAALDDVANEVQMLKDYAAALKTQKRGLAQKLLTGQWRMGLSNRKTGA